MEAYVMSFSSNTITDKLESGLEAMRREDYPTARAHLTQALIEARNAGDRRAEYKVIGPLIQSNLLAGKPDQATVVAKEALTLATNLFGSRHTEVAWCLNALAMSLVQVGHHEEALSHLEKALEILVAYRAGSVQEVVATIINMGACFEGMGDREAQARSYELGLMICRSIGSPSEMVSRLMDRLAATYQKLGRTLEARCLREEALATAVAVETTTRTGRRAGGDPN
jgi:Tfp pilus assembly protein PilF